MVRPATVGSRMCLSPGVPRRTRPAPNPWRGGVRRTQWPPQTPRRRSPRHVTASPSVNRRPPSPMPTTQVAQHHPPSPPLRSVIDFLDSYRRGMSPPGVLATRLAGRSVVPTGRAARRSRANVRHPATAQLPTAQPFVLDGLPGTTPCRPRSVAGEGRAFGACCFAGKLRSPAGPALAALRRSGLTPTSFPTSTPTSFPTPPVAYPSCPAWPHLSSSVPLGGVERPRRMVRFARLIHPARPRSWRTCGPRRLRRHPSLP